MDEEKRRRKTVFFILTRNLTVYWMGCSVLEGVATIIWNGQHDNDLIDVGKSRVTEKKKL